MDNNLIAIDVSKSVFHAVGLDTDGQECTRKVLKRNKLLPWIARQESRTICMEACSSSNFWGREFQKLGLQVRLIPAQFVKPFVQGNKNDFNDALAIAESAYRPNMHTVPVKTVEQQDQQSIRRIRSQLVAQRVALGNQIRSILSENGLVIRLGVSQLRVRVPEILEDAGNQLSSVMREVLARQYEYFLYLTEQIKFYTHQLEALVKQNDDCQRLMEMPGFGPITSSAFVGYVGDGRRFRRGRDVSASLGLVPRQHTSADKQCLLGISKRGNRELRTLLIHGARSYLRVAAKKKDRLSRWVVKLAERIGKNKAAVALANKMARIGWAIVRKQEPFNPDHALAA